MHTFCINNPDDKACIYYNPNYNKYYQDFVAASTLDGLRLPNTTPLCWKPACQGTNLVSQLYTTDMQKTKDAYAPEQIKICQQVIEVQRTKGDLNIYHI